MKKSLLFAVSCAVLLGACTKNENPQNDIPDGTIRFEVNAVNNLETRANLYSQEAVQSVANVNVYAFQKSGTNYLYYKTYTIAGWTEGSTFGRYDVPTADMVPAGDYKFLAVGRDATDNFTLPTLTTGTTNYNDFIVSVSAAGMETEIFSGTKDATVASQGMRIPITITRQVAGVLGYFKNVPAEIGGTAVKYLRLTVSNSNKNLNLTTGVGTMPTATSFNIINADLSTQTVNTDGTYAGNDLSAQNVVKVANSQLNGAFVIPVNGITFTLGLYSATNAPLKTWSVMNDGSASTFNILPNHFYALGTKVAKGTTTGTPENPTPDSPIDLMRDQSITITISPNWTTIHNMTIQ